jgi:hypothetical protein
LNRNNNFKIIDNLPTYRIFIPSLNKYLGLMNVFSSQSLSGAFQLPLADPFYGPLVVPLPTNSAQGMNQWNFEKPATAVFHEVIPPNGRIVKMRNRIYYESALGFSTCCTSQTSVNCVPVVNCSTQLPSSVGYVVVGRAVTPPSKCTAPTNQYLSPTETQQNGTSFVFLELPNNTFTLETANDDPASVRVIALDFCGDIYAPLKNATPPPTPLVFQLQTLDFSN